jgi:hypothetical protein
VLFAKRFWPGIADGSVTLAFRRWKRAVARPGARHRTPAGVIEIVAVDVVDPEAIDEADARAAGFRDRAELLAWLDRREGEIHRVEFRYAGPDPRAELRERAELSEAELAEILARLERLDRASHSGPWTAATLAAIAARPAVLAADVAAGLGRERAPFKRDVRKLKELGLTESLEVGYRLSPRGRAVARVVLADDESTP